MATDQAAVPDPEAKWWTSKDVAAYLHVDKTTVCNYRRREQMPAPDETIGRTHVWQPKRIIDWHANRPRPGTGGRPTHKPKIASEGEAVEAAQ